MNIIEILEKINSDHRVKFTGMSSDFYSNSHWPTPIDFRLGPSEYDLPTHCESIKIIEIEDTKLYSRSQLLRYFTENRLNSGDTFKFFFNGTEVFPRLGDIGYSDKITQIYFELKNI